MDSILEVIFAFFFAGAIAEWRRRRELRSIEKILRDHYSEKEDKSVSADSTVSTLKWLMSSDVRLAVRLERLRKKKAETELRLLRQREEAALKLAEAERRREEKAARRAEFRSKTMRIAKVVMIFIAIAILLFVAIAIHAHAYQLNAGMQPMNLCLPQKHAVRQIKINRGKGSRRGFDLNPIGKLRRDMERAGYDLGDEA